MVLGLALHQLGDLDGALTYLNQVVAQEPKSSASHQASSVELARIHVRRGDDWETARACLLPVLEHGRDDYKIHAIHLLAEIYAQNDMKAKAIAALERGIALFPEHNAFTVQKQAIAETGSAPDSK